MFRVSRSRLLTWSLVLPIASDFAPPAISTCGSPRLAYGKKDGIKTGILPIFPSVPPWPAVTPGRLQPSPLLGIAPGAWCLPQIHPTDVSFYPVPLPSSVASLDIAVSSSRLSRPRLEGGGDRRHQCEPWSSPMAVRLCIKGDSRSSTIMFPHQLSFKLLTDRLLSLIARLSSALQPYQSSRWLPDPPSSLLWPVPLSCPPTDMSATSL